MTHRDDIHDDEFEDYLKRDSTLSRQYQNSSNDDVPPELDKKIITQARDAISDKKVVTHPSWWIKWNKPMALAASLMLAFTVIYKVGYQSINHLAEPEAMHVAEKDSNYPSSGAALTQDAARVEDKASLANEPIAGLRKEDEQALNEPVQRAQPHPFPSSIPSSIPSPSIQKTLPAHPAEAAAPAPTPAPPTSVLAMAPAEAKQEPQSAGLAVSGNLDKSTEQPKKEAARVVDSITAEDIGKFPDTNVAESLQRVPGVTIQRDATPAKEKKARQKNDPEYALQHVRELRKQGKKKEADKAWKQFQIDFPYYEVTADDPARG